MKWLLQRKRKKLIENEFLFIFLVEWFQEMCEIFSKPQWILGNLTIEQIEMSSDFMNFWVEMFFYFIIFFFFLSHSSWEHPMSLPSVAIIIVSFHIKYKHGNLLVSNPFTPHPPNSKIIIFNIVPYVFFPCLAVFVFLEKW